MPKKQKTSNKQGIIRDYSVGYKKPPESTRFKKGVSGNPAGRPKNFAELRALAKEIAAEEIKGTTLTRIEAMLLAMSSSRNANDRRLFLEYAFGKVKEEVEVTWREKAKELGYDPDQLIHETATALAALGAGTDNGGGDSDPTE